MREYSRKGGTWPKASAFLFRFYCVNPFGNDGQEQHAIPFLCLEFCLAWVHMDFRPGNILINNRGVAGVIDFESARGGASEIDFTKMNRYIWEVYPHSKAAYKEGYSTIRPLADLDAILPFYNFYDAISAVAWCKSRGVEKHKAFLEESAAFLRKTVGY